MRIHVYICLMMSLCLGAQDKVFFKSGKTSTGKFVSLAAQELYFIYKDSSQTSAIDKKDVLLVELSNGERYLVGNGKKVFTNTNPDSSFTNIARNAFGVQPFGIFVGRVTFVYERFSRSGKLGLCIPFSLTFDPIGVFYTSADTSMDSPEHIAGVSYITGLDLNYYFNEMDGSRFFMGPRIRYGTDKMLRGLEGYSIQYQIGLHAQGGKNMSQHISVGYGFVKILNVPSSSTVNPEQLYGWLSINYRLSLLW